MEKYKLLKPITFEGEEVTEIEYDLDAINGSVVIATERELGASGDIKAVPYASPEFHALIFAKAAKKPAEFVLALKAPDFVEVTSVVHLFLLGQG